MKRAFQPPQKPNDSRPQNPTRASRGGFRGRGRGGRFNNLSRPRDEVLRTSAVVPGKPERSSDQLSVQKRNEMLAKGLCFNCSEPGHLSRNCPKTNNVPSKKKGKPPGFSAHAAHIPNESSSSRDALYESTQVLETLHIGAIQLQFNGVEEGGEPLQNLTSTITEPPNNSPSESEFETLSDTSSWSEISRPDHPPRPAGDLYAFYAALMLQAAQPYPGDSPSSTEDNFEEKRFLLYLISDHEYVIMDSERDEQLTLEVHLLHNPDFMPALWYAQTLADNMGLDENTAMVNRYLEEIGDAQANALQIIFDLQETPESGCKESEHPDSYKHDVWTEGDHIVVAPRASSGLLKLPKRSLEDSTFDLSGWYVNAARDRLTAKSCDSEESDNDDLDSMPGLHSVSGSECGSDEAETHFMPPLEPVSNSSDSGSDKYNSDTDPDMPALQAVSDSSEGDSDSETAGFVMPGDADESFEDRLRL